LTWVAWWNTKVASMWRAGRNSLLLSRKMQCQHIGKTFHPRSSVQVIQGFVRTSKRFFWPLVGLRTRTCHLFQPQCWVTRSRPPPR